MSERHQTRVRVLFAFFFLFALVIVGRLYIVQVVHGDQFVEEANRQYGKPQNPLFDRGAVYFSTKNNEVVSAATLESGFTLAINPSRLTDAAGAYVALSSIVALDADDFANRASKVEDPYEEIAHHLDETTAQQIQKLEIPGISVYKDRWRFYPGGTLAAHVLGFVGFDGDTLTGRYGVERSYEHVLARGEEGLYENLFAQLFSDTENETDLTNEGSLVMTIEPTVQSALETELAAVFSEWSPRTVGGVVMDPMTGAIVALANLPTFDPNTFSEEDLSVFTNPIVEGRYELGSIMKPLTMAAGLDAGVVKPETTYTDVGTLSVDGYTISNYDKKGRGPGTTMYQVLGQSLNTGVAFVVEKLGNDRFSRYFRSFGLGEETGIDLPNETVGTLENLDAPRDIEHVTAAYGQGISVTPIAMTRALASLGNGGFLVTPHVGKETRYELGYTKSIAVPENAQVISRTASETITRMLVRVVDEWLVGGKAKMEHYSIAAKTGTAQIPQPGGGYYDDRYLHSFFGYFPAYEPRFIIFLFMNEPEHVQYASETLTEPFMNLVKLLISYYEIPPDR